MSGAYPPESPHAAACELAGARIAAGIRELVGEGGEMGAAELASGIALALNLILNALAERR
jgi:hypothetical protein